MALSQERTNRVSRSAAISAVAVHMFDICETPALQAKALASLERMVNALPTAIREDIPAATLEKLADLDYEGVAQLCRSQLAHHRPLCRTLYPLLMEADFFPPTNASLIEAREVCVVLLTELALLSELMTATGVAVRASSEESGVTAVTALE